MVAPTPGQPQAAGLLSGQVLGAAAGPAAGTLLVSARLSLNKQGCIATAPLKEPTAPSMGEREPGDISPWPHFLWGSLGH